MALPELVKQLVETKLKKYCKAKIPGHVRDKIRLTYQIKGNNVTLIEERPYFQDPSIWTESPVAQFRYNAKENEWSLYCRDRNSKWHLFTEFIPSPKFDDLLEEIDDDPTGIFWG